MSYRHHPRHHAPGPHELGQNYLTDPRVVSAIVRDVAATTGPIIEIGPGNGVLTRPLAGLGRPVTAVEVDPRNARRLARRMPQRVKVVRRDVLSFDLPPHPHVLVGNLPFHLTTAILRKILAAGSWTDAVLLVQWEVARRRAGVGGATMLTASWWPWYDFTLLQRVPSRAFRPMPSVDGGLLRVTRRERPLVREQRAYQRFVQRVFTGPGRGVPDIVRRTRRVPKAQLDQWMRRHGVTHATLPKQLTAEQWASLWALVRNTSPGQPRRRPPRAEQ